MKKAWVELKKKHLQNRDPDAGFTVLVEVCFCSCISRMGNHVFCVDTLHRLLLYSHKSPHNLILYLSKMVCTLSNHSVTTFSPRSSVQCTLTFVTLNFVTERLPKAGHFMRLIWYH